MLNRQEILKLSKHVICLCNQMVMGEIYFQISRVIHLISGVTNYAHNRGSLTCLVFVLLVISHMKL